MPNLSIADMFPSIAFNVLLVAGHLLFSHYWLADSRAAMRVERGSAAGAPPHHPFISRTIECLCVKQEKRCVKDWCSSVGNRKKGAQIHLTTINGSLWKTVLSEEIISFAVGTVGEQHHTTIGGFGSSCIRVLLWCSFLMVTADRSLRWLPSRKEAIACGSQCLSACRGFLPVAIQKSVPPRGTTFMG